MIHRSFRVGPDEWTVFDVRPEDFAVLDSSLVAGWLCFEHGIQRRRLAPIPEDWHRLSDPELAGLWESAQVAARATPSPGVVDSHTTQLPNGDPARARRPR
jgi:hypothetical protein